MIFAELPIYKRWTNTAIECYLSGCRYSECFIKSYFDSVTSENYKPQCQMKRAVFALVKNIGKPTQEDIERVKYADSTTI